MPSKDNIDPHNTVISNIINKIFIVVVYTGQINIIYISRGIFTTFITISSLLYTECAYYNGFRAYLVFISVLSVQNCHKV